MYTLLGGDYESPKFVRKHSEWKSAKSEWRDVKGLCRSLSALAFLFLTNTYYVVNT